MRSIYLFLIYFSSTTVLPGQPRTDTLLRNILACSDDSLLKAVISQPETFRLQIIYTQIDRDRNNRPSFHNHYLNFDNSLYFNPASTVKLPLALLALEKLNRIGRKDVTKHTAIQFDSSYAGQVPVLYDSTSENYFPTVA